MTKAELYIQNLLDSNPLRDALLYEMVESLTLPVDKNHTSREA